MLGKIFMLLSDSSVTPSLRVMVLRQLQDHVNGKYCNLAVVYATLSADAVSNRLLALSCAA